MSEDRVGETEQRVSTRGARGALGFVVLFILIIVVLLTGYRFVVDSKANDWYLMRVAKHSGWVLGHVGQSANVDVVSEGPRVRFVLTAGLREQIEELEGQLLDRGKVLDRQSTTRSAKTLRAELESLRQRQQSALTDPEKRKDVLGDRFTFIIVPECGAIEVMAIFLAAVLAFPTGAWKRITGAIVGIPVLYCVNIVRLACLGYIGAVDTTREWFNFTHEYIWQTVYVVFVVAVWLLWVEYVVKRRA